MLVKVLRVHWYPFWTDTSPKLTLSKAVLYGKLKGAQCSEPVKSRVPSIWFVWKIWDLLVARGQKLGTRGHWALLEHSPYYPVIFLHSLQSGTFLRWTVCSNANSVCLRVDCQSIVSSNKCILFYPQVVLTWIPTKLLMYFLIHLNAA